MHLVAAILSLNGAKNNPKIVTKFIPILLLPPYKYS